MTLIWLYIEKYISLSLTWNVLISNHSVICIRICRRISIFYFHPYFMSPKFHGKWFKSVLVIQEPLLRNSHGASVSISALRRWTILRRYVFFKSRSLLGNPGRSDYTPADNTRVSDTLMIFRCFTLPDVSSFSSILKRVKTRSSSKKKEDTNLW